MATAALCHAGTGSAGPRAGPGPVRRHGCTGPPREQPRGLRRRGRPRARGGRRPGLARLDRTVNGHGGSPPMYLADDRPLRIAFLAYRGKPHVGGQGVYTRHLTKALVDLGHHVEVLGGQPFPVLDERVPLHRAAEPRHLQRPLPDADAGHLGAEALDRLRRGHQLLVRAVPRAAGVLAAGMGPPAQAQAATSTSSTTTSASATGCSPIQRDFPLLGDDPPPDHRRPAARAGARPDAVPAHHAAPLVLVHEHADAGGPAARADRHRVGEQLRTTSSRTTASTRAAWRSCPSASIPTCSARCPASSASRAGSITTASADVTMKGLRFLLEARGQAAHRARRHPRRHRPAEGGRPRQPRRSSGSG